MYIDRERVILDYLEKLRERHENLSIKDLKICITHASEVVQKAERNRDTLQEILIAKLKEMFDDELLDEGSWECPDSPIGVCLLSSSGDKCLVCGLPD